MTRRKGFSACFVLLSLLLLVLFPVSNCTVLYVRTMANIPVNFAFAGGNVAIVPPNTLSEPPSASVCPPATSTQFVLSLQQQNLDILEQLFYNVSNPVHPMYQKFQTPTTLWNLIGPSMGVVRNIATWVHNAGVPEENIHFYGDVLEIDTTCGIVNTLFNTTMYVYTQMQSNQNIISQFGTSYLPDEYAPYIHMVIGVQTFPVPAANNVAYSPETTSVEKWDDPFSQFNGMIRTKPNSPAHAQVAAQRMQMQEHTEDTEMKNHTFTLKSAPSPPQSEVVIGPTLQVLYGLPDRTNWYPTSNFQPTVSVGVVEFPVLSPESYNPTDLRHFADYSGYSYPFQLNPKYVVGDNRKHQQGLEATVDIQSVSAVNPQAAAWFWLMPSNTWIYSWAYQFYSQIESGLPYPQVVSISYTSSDEYYNCGIPGSTDCEVYGINPTDTGDSYSYESRTNTLFQMIGLSGVTILVSSGDDGANGIYGYPIAAGEANTMCSYTETTLQFVPEWPSTSPYITSVGATNTKATGFGSPTYSHGQFSKAQLCGAYTPSGPPPFNFHCEIGNLHEAAVSFAQDRFTSGGGFSTIYLQPWYQTQAINTWWNSNPYKPSYPVNTTSYLFNTAFRAFPDISAYGGLEWLALWQNQFHMVGGTSLSAPVAAGIITLLNEIAIAQSGKPLGFINPLLYQMQADTFGTPAAAFNDIVQGNNIQPRFALSDVTCDGFYTAVGWDPVTGLGTPNFPNMQQYLVNLFTTGQGYQYSSTGSYNSNSGNSSVSSTPFVFPSIVGDPQFNGFAGQIFQVHGLPNAIYNVVSTPTLQFNAEFAFLKEGFCSKELQERTMCWTHTGNYLGTVAILWRPHDNATQYNIVVRSGAHDEGMIVFVNEAVLTPSTEPVLLLSPRHPSSHNASVILRLSSAFSLTVETPEFIIELENSHHFVNQQVGMQPALSKLIKQTSLNAMKAKRPLTANETMNLPHGLLGQTWNKVTYANQWKHIQGHLADYQLSDGLLGHDFQYNRYHYDAEQEKIRLEEMQKIRARFAASRGDLGIGGQVDGLLPHMHDEETEQALSDIVLPLSPEELIKEQMEDSQMLHIRDERNKPLGKAVELTDTLLEMIPTVVRPVGNKPNVHITHSHSSEMVWSSVQPETIQHYEGPLDPKGYLSPS